MGGGKGGGGRTKSADAAVHPVNISLGSLDTKRAPPRNKMAAFDASLMAGKKAESSPLSAGNSSSDIKFPLVGGNLLYGGNMPSGTGQGLNMWGTQNSESSSSSMLSMSMNMLPYSLLGFGTSGVATQVPDTSLAKAEYSRQSAEKRRNRIQKRKERKRELRASSNSSRGCATSAETSGENRVHTATTTTTTRSYCSHSDDDEDLKEPPIPQEDDHEGEVQDPFLHRLMTRGLAVPHLPNSNTSQRTLPSNEGDSNISSESNTSVWPKWNAEEIKHVRSVVLEQEKSFKRQLEKLHLVNERHTKHVRKQTEKILAELPTNSSDQQATNAQNSQLESVQSKDASKPSTSTPLVAGKEPSSSQPAGTQDMITRWHMQTYGNTMLDFRKMFTSAPLSAFGSPNLSQFSNQEGDQSRSKVGLDSSQLSQFSATTPVSAKSNSGPMTTLMPKAKAATPETARDILKSLGSDVDQSST